MKLVYWMEYQFCYELNWWELFEIWAVFVSGGAELSNSAPLKKSKVAQFILNFFQESFSEFRSKLSKISKESSFHLNGVNWIMFSYIWYFIGVLLLTDIEIYEPTRVIYWTQQCERIFRRKFCFWRNLVNVPNFLELNRPKRIIQQKSKYRCFDFVFSCI